MTKVKKPHGTDKKIIHKQQQQQHISALDQKVYTLLAKVPKGRVTTYGELAKAAGIKNGQRVIGRIMGKNPYPGIIPCHRVVMSTGQIGGYAYGADVKEKMLISEGINFTVSKKIAGIKDSMYTFGQARVRYKTAHGTNIP